MVVTTEADAVFCSSLLYYVPYEVKTGNKIITHFKFLDVLDNDSLARLDQEKTFPLVLQDNRNNASTRIEAYLKKNKIKAEATADTVFIERLKDGDEEQVALEDI